MSEQEKIIINPEIDILMNQMCQDTRHLAKCLGEVLIKLERLETHILEIEKELKKK